MPFKIVRNDITKVKADAIVYTKGKYGKRNHRPTDTDNPYLYSYGRYPTKLQEEDLPECFVPIRSRVIHYMDGYVRTCGITDIKYTWVKLNHLFKDDYIYISYHGPLKEVTSPLWLNWFF